VHSNMKQKNSCSEESYDTETFMGFLRKLLTAYPTGKIVMILDKARIHRATRIQRLLEENRNRLELIFLPPYNPEPNLLEVVSKWLKESIIQLIFFDNGHKIILAVQAILQDVNQRRDETSDRLYVRTKFFNFNLYRVNE